MRRGKPEVLVAVLILGLLASYVWYTQHVIISLRADARVSSKMYQTVYHALADQNPGAEEQALQNLSQTILEQGVPLIWLDPGGRPAGHANLPFIKDSPEG